MDLGGLEEAVGRYTASALAPATWRAYAAGQRRFRVFFDATNTPLLPAQEATFCLWAAALADEGLQYQTIRGYLAAVRNLHITSGFPDPFVPKLLRLDLVLRGIQRERAKTSTPDSRQPITPAILRQIRGVWSHRSADFDTAMLWAAVCTGFFGCLRPGELTTNGSFDPTRHLSPQDLLVDSAAKPSWVRLKIKSSKTDQLAVGADVFLDRTADDLCPVGGLLVYVARRGVAEGPLFRFADGLPLSRALLVERLRPALKDAGLPAASFGGHSLRIGAATTAAARGVGDERIRALGRWRSNCYMRYIRLAADARAPLSATLSLLLARAPATRWVFGLLC